MIPLLPKSVIFALLLSGALAAPADFIRIQLPDIFSNNMILQRDQPNPLWGKSSPLKPVKVILKSGAHIKALAATTSDINGNWKIRLPAVAAGGPYDLEILGTDRVQFHNVIFGDVFLMLGQSNMIIPTSWTDQYQVTATDIRFSKIRWFLVAPRIAEKEEWQVPGVWKRVTTKTVGMMPAVPYYFAERMAQKTTVPIGVIVSGYGGTPVNAWAVPKAFEIRKGRYGGWENSSAFNALVAPLLGLGIRAIVWYQGEADVCNASDYANILGNFITSLRNKWGNSALPFFIVQLPGYGPRTEVTDESAWAEIREAQAKAASTAGAGLIVTTDTAQKQEPIHPKHKFELGHRIADTVFAELYLKSKDIFPSMDSFKMVGRSVILSFNSKHALVSSTGKILKGFIIAGSNKKFVMANAELDADGKQVAIWNPSIKHPCVVRYAWTDNPICSLFDQSGFPVGPFRTDAWNLPHRSKLEDYAQSGVTSNNISKF